MSPNRSSKKQSESLADRLERKLAKIKAAERKKFLNENIVRLEKNGDLSYKAVRTGQVPIREGEAPAEPVGRAVPAARAGHQCQPQEQPSGPAADRHSVGQLEPNFYTETPDSAKIGQQFAPSATASDSTTNPGRPPEVPAAQEVPTAEPIQDQSAGGLIPGGISIHEPQTSGQKIAPDNDQSADPLEELLARALSRPGRGRPAAFDEHSKGKLVALLSLGMSLRQAAAVLGVSHGTIRNTLKADPALAEEINAARFQAQLQPLACVIREARRSWKAATWLLKYLDSKIASHEETPDERRQRQQRETAEFLAGAGGQHVNTRKVLG